MFFVNVLLAVLEAISDVLHQVAAWFVVLLLALLALGGVWLDLEKRMRHHRNAKVGSLHLKMTSAASAEKTLTSTQIDTTSSGQNKVSVIADAADRAKTSGESC